MTHIDPQSHAKDHLEGLDKRIDTLEKRRSAKEDDRLAERLKGQVIRSLSEKTFARVLSGALYFILVVGCLFAGVIPTTILVCIMAWLSCSEFFRMIRLSGRMPNEIVGLAAAVLFPLSVLASRHAWILLTVFALVLATAVWFVVTPRATTADAAVTVFGPIYTGLLFASVILLRTSNAGPMGALLTLGILGSVWVNDSMAYLAGSRLGRHHLAPKISPNKTWEGFFGGILGSVLTWIILWAALRHFFNVDLGLLFTLFSGIVIGIISVIGDLFESRVKRGVGVKDSGDIMPGHGGMLDRGDSLLFAAAAAYFLLIVGGIL